MNIQTYKKTTREAISRESLDALMLKQMHKAKRAFIESVCRNCPDANDDVCPFYPCRLARRSVLALTDALVDKEIGWN